MLVGEAGEFEGVRRGARRVATHQFEQGRMHLPIRERADMGEVRDPRLHAIDERIARSTSPRGHDAIAR